MSKKVTILAIILASTLSQIVGQGIKNELTILTGVGNIKRQDLVFSPFIHSDFTPINLGLEFTRNAEFHQNLKLRYTTFNPILNSPFEYSVNGKTAIAPHHYFTCIDLDYSFGKKIKITKNFTTQIGAIVANDVQLLNYAYGRLGSFGYYSSFGLGGFVSREYMLAENVFISGKFALPLLNWISRSPYLVNDDEFIENISSHSDLKSLLAFIEDGKLASINEIQSFDLEVDFNYHFHKSWAIGLNYLFEFAHLKKPRNLLSYRNSIYFTTKLKF